jgi:ligand-binding SRPBCC domain-containing protein
VSSVLRTFPAFGSNIKWTYRVAFYPLQENLQVYFLDIIIAVPIISLTYFHHSSKVVVERERDTMKSICTGMELHTLTGFHYLGTLLKAFKSI